MIVKGAFTQLLKPGLAKALYEAMYPGKVWFMDKGYFLETANEEGEPIFSEDEPWWVI